jgi:hypothetical protein
MWSFLGGNAVGWTLGNLKNECASVPCRARCLGDDTRKVKIAIRLVSLEADRLDGDQIMVAGKPYIVVEGDEGSRQSCVGEWSPRQRKWLFGEEFSFAAGPKEKLTMTAYVKQEVSLWRVELSWQGPTALGSALIDLGHQVYPKCLPEDRADEGMVFATPALSFVLRDASTHQKCGRLVLRVESHSNPNAAKGFMGGSGGCFDGGQCADPAERVRSRQEPGKYPVLGTQKSFAPSARTVMRADVDDDTDRTRMVEPDGEEPSPELTPTQDGRRGVPLRVDRESLPSDAYVHPALLARAVKDVPKNYKVVMLVVPDIPEEEKLPSMR